MVELKTLVGEKIRGYWKIDYANINQKKVGVMILIPNRAHLGRKKIIRNEEGIT